MSAWKMSRAQAVIERMEHVIDAAAMPLHSPRRNTILYGRLTGPLGGGPHFCVAS